MTADKWFTLFMIIPAIILYIILLYLHGLLYAVLPKKLGGIKTLIYFTYFIVFWILLIYLLTENIIDFKIATLFVALSCVPELIILRERVSKDVGILLNTLHLRTRLK